MKLNYALISNVELEGIKTNDYPDFADAFIASAEYDGRPMTDDELDALNEDHAYIHEKVMEKMF